MIECIIICFLLSQIKPTVTWNKVAWPAEYATLYTMHEDFYAQIIDANCGSFCGSCIPEGSLSLEVAVSLPSSFFGAKNLSIIDNSDGGRQKRNLALSEGRSLKLLYFLTYHFIDGG